MARVEAFPRGIVADGGRPFKLTRAIMGFGLVMPGVMFLSQLSVALIDGWADLTADHRPTLGLAVLGATLCVTAGAAVWTSASHAWKQVGAYKYLALFSSAAFGSFLSGPLIRGQWNLFGVVVIVTALAAFAAAVVQAMRADAQPNQSEIRADG